MTLDCEFKIGLWNSFTLVGGELKKVKNGLTKLDGQSDNVTAEEILESRKTEVNEKYCEEIN